MTGRSLLARLRAFTLIELLIVIIIVGLLMAIGVPVYLKYQDSARDTEAKAQLVNAYKEARAATEEDGSYPAPPQLVTALGAALPNLNVALGDCDDLSSDPDELRVDATSDDDTVILRGRSRSGQGFKAEDIAPGRMSLSEDCSPPSALTPVATSLSPSSRSAGSAGFTLTVNGSDFENGATVRWNGAARTTTFVSATQLTATIPAADIASQGTAAVSVANPGGLTSSNLTFTITVALETYPAAIMSTTGGAPVAYWRLGEASGSTVLNDSSGNGYGGTYTGTHVMYASASGLLSSGTDGARNFWSDTFYGSVPYNAALNPSQFTVEFLFRINQGFWQATTNLAEVINAGSFRIFGRSHTGTSTQGTLGVQLPGSSGLALNFIDQTNVVLLPNTTYHITVSYDGANVRIYVNGILRAAPALASWVPNTSAATRIGSMAGVTQHAQTIIDELAVYNRALGCSTTTIGQTCDASSEIGAHVAAR